jgi:uncharacterized membrane protein
MTAPGHLPSNELPLRPRPVLDMEILVGSILFIGVLLSSSLITIGLGWHWVLTGRLEFEYSLAAMNFFEFLLTWVRQAVSGPLQPNVLVNLGLAMLMLTPYVRVLASIFFFAFVERNWKYTLFTAFVFTVLTYSLFRR